MKKCFMLIFPCFGTGLINAQSITWAKDIAPILYQNCTSCHHEGGAGHGSLVTYQDALSASISIQFQVNAKKMPPWLPDRSYKHFAEERYLTNAQVQKINQWVNAGAPQGNPQDAPQPPVYMNQDEITSPDFSARIPEYTIQNNNDVYRCFVIPTNFAQDMFISGIEVVPGNTAVVHHVLVYQDTTGTARQKDIADPGIGYTSIVGVGTDAANLVGSWVPGQKPFFFPNGMGVKLWRGADLVLQIHYPKNSVNKKDSTKINLKLSSNAATREVYINPLLHHLNGAQGGLINGPLNIPANQKKTFTARFENNLAQGSLLAIAPHMHLIGKSVSVFAVSPTNDTLPLIRINDWDFNWQGHYVFQKLQVLPIGWKAYAVANYDNTTDNERNPNKQNPQNVSLGEGTEDEMMLVYFWYMLYRNGDENLVIDDTDYTETEDSVSTGVSYDDIISTPQFYEPFPNPANDVVNLKFYLPNSESVGFEIYDLNGRLLYEEPQKMFPVGLNDLGVSLQLASGTYQIVLKGRGFVRTKPLIVSK